MAEDDVVATEPDTELDDIEPAGAEPVDLIDEVLVESVSIDGMCGVY